MAAGLGTRLRPFTDLEPKALLPLLGIPMAQFALRALRGVGVNEVVANVHHHARRASDGLRALDPALLISDESAELLGSAGGIRQARDNYPETLGREPFFLLNSDVVSDVDLRALSARHAKLRDQWGVRVTLTVFPRPVGAGKYREIFFDHESGLISRLGEVVANRPYFVGAAVIEPEALAEVPASGPAEFVPTILAPAIRDRKAGVYFASGLWFDVGSPELWLETHLEMIRRMETGDLPREWRVQIEAENLRVAQEVWVRRGQHLRTSDRSQWVGPCYCDPRRASLPKVLGPRAVQYGGTSKGLANGVSMDDLFWEASHLPTQS